MFLSRTLPERLFLAALISGVLIMPLHAQPDRDVPTEVDQEPYFSGCDSFPDKSSEKKQCSEKAIAAFIAANLIYPPTAIENNIQGTVYLRFTVNTTGEVSDITIIRDIGYGCGEAAMDVIRKMPPWQPGYQQGKAVPVSYSMPIRFYLEGIDTGSAPGYSISWGSLSQSRVDKKAIQRQLSEKITARDDLGNPISISDLSFAISRGSLRDEIHSNGTITPRMVHLVRRLRRGDTFILTVTVQKAGRFYFITKNYDIE